MVFDSDLSPKTVSWSSSELVPVISFAGNIDGDVNPELIINDGRIVDFETGEFLTEFIVNFYEDIDGDGKKDLMNIAKNEVSNEYLVKILNSHDYSYTGDNDFTLEGGDNHFGWVDDWNIRFVNLDSDEALEIIILRSDYPGFDLYDSLSEEYKKINSIQFSGESIYMGSILDSTESIRVTINKEYAPPLDGVFNMAEGFREVSYSDPVYFRQLYRNFYRRPSDIHGPFISDDDGFSFYFSGWYSYRVNVSSKGVVESIENLSREITKYFNFDFDGDGHQDVITYDSDELLVQDWNLESISSSIPIQTNFTYGYLVFVGDVDNNGSQEFFFYDRSLSVPELVERDSITGEIIWRSKDEVLQHLIVDLNRDGINEIITSGDGSINIYRKIDGVMVEVFQFDSELNFMRQRLGAQDVDGDGFQELLVLENSCLNDDNNIITVIDHDLETVKELTVNECLERIPTIEARSFKNNIIVSGPVYELVDDTFVIKDGTGIGSDNYDYYKYYEVSINTGRIIWESRNFLGTGEKNEIQYFSDDVYEGFKIDVNKNWIYVLQ